MNNLDKRVLNDMHISYAKEIFFHAAAELLVQIQLRNNGTINFAELADDAFKVAESYALKQKGYRDQAKWVDLGEIDVIS